MKKSAGHMMGYMGMMDDDAMMLCKVLDGIAAQAIELRKRIKMGKKLPSWAEYKVYKAGDSVKSALGATFTMKDHAPKVSIAISPGPSMMGGGMMPEKHKLAWAKLAKANTQGDTEHPFNKQASLMGKLLKGVGRLMRRGGNLKNAPTALPKLTKPQMKKLSPDERLKADVEESGRRVAALLADARALNNFAKSPVKNPLKASNVRGYRDFRDK